jgi:hypothetical protein
MWVPKPEVRAATPAEVEIAASILKEVADWALLRGFGVWPPGIFANPEGDGQRRLRDDVTRGCLHLVWLGHIAVGCFALRGRDERHWPDASEDALYLHRFAVRRAAAGIGSFATGWMIEEVRRRSRCYLRLDCLYDNPRIRRHYETAGFILRGETLDGDTRVSLYEMCVCQRDQQ